MLHCAVIHGETAELQTAEMFMLPVCCITQMTQSAEERPNKANSEEIHNTAVHSREKKGEKK